MVVARRLSCKRGEPPPLYTVRGGTNLRVSCKRVNGNHGCKRERILFPLGQRYFQWSQLPKRAGMLVKQTKELAAKSDDLNPYGRRRELTSSCPLTCTFARWYPRFRTPIHIHTVNKLKCSRSWTFKKKLGKKPDIL